jgi:predicted RNA-binding protein associated with RNAse of E/G family
VILRRHYGFGEPWYEPDLPWRADIVSVSEAGDETVVTDLFVDVCMSEDGTRYKVLDLDELAQAAALGRVSSNDCLEALQMLQRWLDMLHGLRTTRDFPPESLPPSAY